METISIYFVDFWPNFVLTDNYFYHLLATKYRVVIDDEKPDILFHSVDYAKKQEHTRFDNGKTVKIFYTGECVRPDFGKSHYAFTFDYSDDPRCYRLPLWALTLNWFLVDHDEDRDISYLHDMEEFMRPKDAVAIRQTKTKFCSFVASAQRGRRMDFIPKLLKRTEVHCAGDLYNNCPKVIGRGDQIHKVKFLLDYKFNVCFENESYPGYVTEKLVHSMFANCVPVYWGSDRVCDDFNIDSFICANHMSDEQLIETMIRYDENDDLYDELMSKPWFKNNQVPEFVKPKNVLAFIEKALS